MLLLVEMGLEASIPEPVVARMVEVLDRHFLHSFPFRVEEIPPGCDPTRNTICHCAVGSVYVVCFIAAASMSTRSCRGCDPGSFATNCLTAA